MQILGNSFLIIAEIPVRWLPSAKQIPRPDKTNPAMYPVWLMDSLGERASVFVRCPACDAPMGLSPSTMSEQQDWNKETPEVRLMMGCSRCSGTYMIADSVAYCLSLMPPQTPRATAPRVVVAKGQVPMA